MLSIGLGRGYANVITDDPVRACCRPRKGIIRVQKNQRGLVVRLIATQGPARKKQDR